MNLSLFGVIFVVFHHLAFLCVWKIGELLSGVKKSQFESLLLLRMPSANSAKIEKTPSSEATDFIKQCISLVEKKVRNLEKRKAKLDGYKDLSKTKELISDQLVALSKYDQVVEMLEQSKETHKNILTIYQEFVKQSKKWARKEQQERQQHEVSRIKEILLIQDILNNMGSDDIRQDFLNGTNGAIKLGEKELNQLDELYKLISVEREPEENVRPESHNFNELLGGAAENIQLLLDGKNKEILGTTYKALKETILKIEESGYFEQKEETEEGTDGSVKDENIQATETELPPPQPEFVAPVTLDEVSLSPAQALSEVEASPPPQQVNSSYYTAGNASTTPVSNPTQVIFSNQTTSQQPSELPTSQAAPSQQSPLPDVLMQARGNFNFLQESQVDLESPHMDPAVVAAHPMVPPQLTYQQIPGEALLAAAGVRTSTSNFIPAGVVAPPPDYDPARPIPTQTFTNQNFAAMQNMMTAVPPPAGYSPGTGSSVPQPTQLPTTVAMMMSSNQTRNVSAPGNVSDTPPGYQPKSNDGFSKPQSRNYSRSVGNNQQEQTSSGHYQSSDENEETSDGVQNSYNRSNRGASRGNKSRGGSGPSNGYSRGPRGGSGGSFSNGRGNYYGNRERSEGFSSSREREGGYTNNSGPRRGAPSSRGGQRGSGRGNHAPGNRGTGGGSYRSQE